MISMKNTNRTITEMSWNYVVNVVFLAVVILILKNVFYGILGGKNGRGMRVSSYDPDDPMSPSGGTVPQSYNSLDNLARPPQGSGRVSTITQNYTEKTMLLSSDDEN